MKRVSFAALLLLISVFTVRAEVRSGFCGAGPNSDGNIVEYGGNISGILTDDGVLTISSSGRMCDYELTYNDYGIMNKVNTHNYNLQNMK